MSLFYKLDYILLPHLAFARFLYPELIGAGQVRKSAACPA